MAGLSPYKPSKTCQELVHQLRKGQDVLKRSIENINPPVEVAAASRQMLSQRKLDSRYRECLTISLDRVSKLPKKRARLQQLTPEYQVVAKVERGISHAKKCPKH